MPPQRQHWRQRPPLALLPLALLPQALSSLLLLLLLWEAPLRPRRREKRWRGRWMQGQAR
jgi:hypothetical protein